MLQQEKKITSKIFTKFIFPKKLYFPYEQSLERENNQNLNLPIYRLLFHQIQKWRHFLQNPRF